MIVRRRQEQRHRLVGGGNADDRWTSAVDHVQHMLDREPALVERQGLKLARDRRIDETVGAAPQDVLDHSRQAREIQPAIVVERRGYDREHAG